MPTTESDEPQVPTEQLPDPNITVQITIRPDGQHNWEVEVPENLDMDGPAIAVLRGLLDNRISEDANITFTSESTPEDNNAQPPPEI